MLDIKFNNNYCMVIAEIGINHNGDLDTAKELITKAKNSGVDIVKFQNISKETGYNYAQKNNEIYRSIKKYSLKNEDYIALQKFCYDNDILFMSSAADVPAARFLNKLNVPCFKVSSGNFTNFHLIYEISKYKIPVIFSIGMSNPKEIDLVTKYIRKCNIDSFAYTYCVSQYPAELKNINFQVMLDVKEKYHIPIGFSDHTEGIISSIIGRVLGACIIEKHFTLDRNMDGPDHNFSLLPEQMKLLVDSIRNIEEILFSKKSTNAGELEIKSQIRRTLYFNKKLNLGQVITFDDIAAKRPFDTKGVSPMDFENIIGKKVNQEVCLDKLITENILYD